MSVWALLTEALDDARERPPDSVTAEEFAAKANISPVHAGRLLREHSGLRAVHYRRNGRRAVCYVEAK